MIDGTVISIITLLVVGPVSWIVKILFTANKERQKEISDLHKEIASLKLLIATECVTKENYKDDIVEIKKIVKNIDDSLTH